MARTYSSANIFAARETWSFGAVFHIRRDPDTTATTILTNNEGNHGCPISSSGFQAFDQLLHLPDLNVLLGFICLGVTHFGGIRRFKSGCLVGPSR